MEPNKSFNVLPKGNPLTRPLAVSAVINIIVLYILVLITGYFRISFVDFGPMETTALMVAVPPLEYTTVHTPDHEPTSHTSPTSSVPSVLNTTRPAYIQAQAVTTLVSTAPTSERLNIPNDRLETGLIPQYGTATVKGPSTTVRTGVLGSPEGVIPKKDTQQAPTIPSHGTPGFASGDHEGLAGRSGHISGKVKLVGLGDGVVPGPNRPRGKITTEVLPNAVNIEPVHLAVRGTRATDVKVLDHPTPVYTTEAESLRIQGQVVLLVQFCASGRVVVLGQVSPALGHGLDAEAVQVAESTKFTPATVNGKNVDITTHYRVDFQTLN